MLESARKHIADSNALRTLAVWPQAWHAVQVFLAMQTQWRLIVSPLSGAVRYQGLRYEALPLVMAGVRPEIPAAQRQAWPELMRQLQVLELAAAAWRNKQ